MLLLSETMAPLPIPGERMDGMITKLVECENEGGKYHMAVQAPGAILGLWLELRKRTGVLAAKKKKAADGEKVPRFAIRSAEELIDKIREHANDLGILIYPGPPMGAQGSMMPMSSAGTTGRGHVVEDGTLAEVTLTVIAQAIEDGSRLAFGGFGLGADNQDKAGGKAGTYAFKQALIQSLLAGGAATAKKLGVADTDDTDTPIDGGVKPKTRKKAPTPDELIALFESLEDGDKDGYEAALKTAMTASVETQLKVKQAVKDASARCKGSNGPVQTK